MVKIRRGGSEILTPGLFSRPFLLGITSYKHNMKFGIVTPGEGDFILKKGDLTPRVWEDQ